MPVDERDKSLTLDQLVAVSDEIAGLGRAGMPLERGLRHVAKSLHGPGGHLAGRLAAAMESGSTLAEAVDAEGEQLPELYRAIVKAGLKSGNLTKGLEQFSEVATRLGDLRHSIGLALVYPFVVLSITWGLVQFTSEKLLPEYWWIDVERPTYFAQTLTILMTGFKFLIPLFLLLGLLLWWRSASASSGIIANSLPLIGRARRLSASACFIDLLRLLLNQRTPLPEALLLAADATGWRPLQRRSHEIAERVNAGSASLADLQGLPALVRLALKNHAGDQQRDKALARAADSYRRRADAWSRQLNLFLPVIASGAIGGFIVLAYGLYALGPYFESLNILAAPEWSAIH